MPELPDLNSPEFAPIKARLARAYLEHKADLGVPDATDEAVLARVDEITAIFFASSGRAGRAHDQRWKERYGWFAAIMSELIDDGYAESKPSSTAEPQRRRRGRGCGGITGGCKQRTSAKPTARPARRSTAEAFKPCIELSRAGGRRAACFSTGAGRTPRRRRGVNQRGACRRAASRSLERSGAGQRPSRANGCICLSGGVTV